VLTDSSATDGNKTAAEQRESGGRAKWAARWSAVPGPAGATCSGTSAVLGQWVGVMGLQGPYQPAPDVRGLPMRRGSLSTAALAVPVTGAASYSATPSWNTLVRSCARARRA